MSTEQKLAQMMVVAFRSDPQNTLAATEVSPAYEELLKKYDSVERILKLKYDEGIMSETLADSEEDQLALVKETVGSPEHLTRDWEITQKSMTLLKNDGDLLPLDGKGPFNLNVAVALCTAFGQSDPQGKLPVNIPKVDFAEDGKAVFSDEVLYERGFGK